MGILTDDMKRVVRQQRLGFIATVCPDGSPNLSPKGTATVWDDDHLVFADLGSPVTIENLGHNPACEINVIDTFLRKGYRFKGTAQVLTGGDLFDEIKEAYATGSHGIQRSGLPARGLRVDDRNQGRTPGVAGIHAGKDGGGDAGRVDRILGRGAGEQFPVG